MLLKANPLVPAAISGTGVMSGVIAFTNLIPVKIQEILEIRDKKLLNLEGDEEVGLVLAQQYRETGAITPGKDRDFGKQWDPGFLSKQDGLSYVRQIISSDSRSKNEFERDEKIANLLRQKCKESLNSNYTQDLYSDVIRWCSLDLPNYARDILKFQKQKGNCRFGLVHSENQSVGQLVWEAATVEIIPKQQLLQLKSALQEQSSSGSTSQANQEAINTITTECVNKKHKYLELSFHPSSNDALQKIGKFTSDWNKEHKSPTAE